MQAAEPLVAQRSASWWLTLADAVARPLQQERRAHLLHQVEFIVGGRAVDAEPDARRRPLPARRPGSSRTPASGCCRRNG